MFEKLKLLWFVLLHYPDCTIVHNLDMSPNGSTAKNVHWVTYTTIHDFVVASPGWIGIKVEEKK